MKARLLGVSVKTSENKKKKIDVFKKGVKIASVGQAGAMDYPNYLKKKDKEVAEKRRIFYKKRHEKDRKVIGSAGYYADRLLWS